MSYIIEHGIVDVATLEEIEMRKRNEMLSSHPFSIWQGSDKYWRTYIIDDSKKNGRRLIKRRNRTDIEDLIIENIKLRETVSIEHLFLEFIERKSANDGIKPSTITRYKNVFNRHFVQTEWNQKDIRKVYAEDFSDFIEDEIARCELNAKATANLRGVLTGILKRARKRRLIDYTASAVYDMIDCKAKPTIKHDSDEILTPAELKAFMEYCESHQTVVTLALLLMTVTGCRVGEICALKYADFESDTCFHVERTETYYQDANGKWIYEISPVPKTMAGIRICYIPSQYAWIVKKLRKLNPFAEYLCTGADGERMKSQVIKQKMRQITHNLPEFKKPKSTHKLRKTYCSMLLDNGMDENFILHQMGHTDIRTSEKYYHYDRKTAQQKQEKVDSIVEFKVV